ncbi:MAG: acyl-CoA dehydrogenase family protein, partial [Firmicutes bacterium]|nr:acyl-CoA dehydrogenase family protein [Bacillota bacterium]
MNFGLTEDQRMIQDMAKRFAENEIAPHVEEDEKNHYFRKEIHDKMAELGFFGFCIEEQYGGNGMGFVEACLVTEQLAKVH